MATCVATDDNVSAKTIRANCLECSGDLAKAVTWCSCDGLHSTLCRFWKARFGMRPATFRARCGDRLVTPEMMPPADTELDLLPASWDQAATGEIDIEGYHQPAVEIKRPTEPKRPMTPAQAEGLRRGRERGRLGARTGLRSSQKPR